MGAFCRVGLSGDYYLPSLQRAHRPRWTTLSASEPGAGDKLGARLRHSARVCLVLHELALWTDNMPILFIDTTGRTHYRWWFRLIKIVMNKPKPKRPTEVNSGVQNGISNVIKHKEIREIKPTPPNLDLRAGHEPTGPMQTCGDLKKEAQPPTLPPE